MKTTMKQLTAVSFVALILLVSNVSAEGTQAKASGYVNNEFSLQIENWMINSDTWNVKTSTIDFVDQSDSPLELENWMMANWEMQSMLAVQDEPALEVENWMTSADVWNAIDYSAENETALNIENWMMENKAWNN